MYTLILTVYAKTKPSDFERSLTSMMGQTVPPDQIIVVEDGPIPMELAQSIDSNTGKIDCTRIRLDINSGPALAAQAGINASRNELIARLDTDDEAYPTRLEDELRFLDEHPEYVSVGTLVREVDESGRVVARVSLPESFEEIRDFARRRCPCRQTTLLYKKSAIIEVGGYRALRVAEEWDLYNRFIAAGMKCYNIQLPMVDMHVEDEYFARRGGIAVLKQLLSFKAGMLLRQEAGLLDFIVSSVASIIACLVPNSIREFIYIRLLRTGNRK